MTKTANHERRRMKVFYAKDSQEVEPEMMPREGFDESVLAGIAKVSAAGMSDVSAARTRVVFKEPGEDGMSLIYAWFKSGFVLPFHSHDVDCLYYVTGGELRMGSHVLRKGDGMFVPKDHGYGFEAGPEGVEVLEFRNATCFNFVFKANSEKHWDRIADTYRERGPIWAEELTPPSDR